MNKNIILIAGEAHMHCYFFLLHSPSKSIHKPSKSMKPVSIYMSCAPGVVILNAETEQIEEQD